MASHNKTSKLLEKQRSRKPQQQRSVKQIILADLFSHINSNHYLSAIVPLGLCQECSEPIRQKTIHRNRKWGKCDVAAQYITSIILSMLILLATAQDVMSQQLLRAADEGDVLTTLNVTNTNLSNLSGTLTRAEHILEPLNETISNTNNKILTSTLHKKFIAEIPGVSFNRNSLMRADNILQRQLREKAKKDSLETIKMHILMRLNLKKLPNITKPITVPQNILENFYKNYNTSSTYSAPIKLDNNPPSDYPPPRTDIHVSDEIQNEPIKSSSEPTLPNEKLFLEMQGDDPSVYDKHLLNHNVPFDEKQNTGKTNNNGFSNLNYDGEYESILSHISSIYIFPEQTHLRHNHKIDVLRFKFDLSYSEISYVTLHLYLRGLEWIRVNQPRIIRQIANYPNEDIVVSVHRAIRRTNSTNYTHKAKMFEFRHKIPSGQGQWVNVDLKPLFLTETTQFPADKSQTQDIFIQGVEPWMQPLVVTSDNNSKKSLTVHIEIGSQKKNRRKRSVFMDCTESDHDMRCCRYPLKVNFTSFGWHFVVAPTSFDAYFCSGDCRVGYLEQYPHTHLAALTTSATPCCSPTKMSSLSLLYFDDNQNLVLSVIPNMSVEGCSCS